MNGAELAHASSEPAVEDKTKALVDGAGIAEEEKPKDDEGDKGEEEKENDADEKKKRM